MYMWSLGYGNEGRDDIGETYRFRCGILVAHMLPTLFSLPCHAPAAPSASGNTCAPPYASSATSAPTSSVTPALLRLLSFFSTSACTAAAGMGIIHSAGPLLLGAAAAACTLFQLLVTAAVVGAYNIRYDTARRSSCFIGLCVAVLVPELDATPPLMCKSP